MNTLSCPKKRIARVLAAVLALLCAFCFTRGTPVFAEAPAPEGAGVFSADGSLIFEKDGLTVTTAGLDTDPGSGDDEPIVWVDIENSGDTDAFLGLTAGSVNGFMTDVVFIEFYMEDGDCYGGNYTFDLTIPAGEGGRYALGYYTPDCPGVKLDTLSELAFCFTLAEDEFSWPDYCSEPVSIVTGEEAEKTELASLGSVVIDDGTLTMVLGEQDYDDVFGPEVYVYVENKTGNYLALAAETAEADGAFSDFIYYYEAIAPGRMSAAFLCFEGEIKELKSFENLSLSFTLFEAETEAGLEEQDGAPLGPVSVQYPPQVWGEYENAGLCMDIRPKYNELVTVETPADDPNGILFTVSETASLEVGGYEGAGWLFSIARIDEDALHELLCYDMSGAEVFAKDGDGYYYVFCHPTDVRFERATLEEMRRDAEQWSMLCEWAWDMPGSIADRNGLDFASFSNTEVDIYLARAAWMESVNFTLSTTEFGPLPAAGVDGAPYVEQLMQGWFWDVDPEETPDGEYVVLSFPDEDLRLDFFFAPGDYVRVVSGDSERLYQAVLRDGDDSCAELMQRWYYDAAQLAGLK